MCKIQRLFTLKPMMHIVIILLWRVKGWRTVCINWFHSYNNSSCCEWIYSVSSPIQALGARHGPPPRPGLAGAWTGLLRLPRTAGNIQRVKAVTWTASVRSIRAWLAWKWWWALVSCGPFLRRPERSTGSQLPRADTRRSARSRDHGWSRGGEARHTVPG